MINIIPTTPPYNFNVPHIYRYYLPITGKYYIGKHNGNNPNYKGSGIEWKLALQQYSNGLVKEILEYIDDISKLNEREIYWLNKFNAASNPLYYNKTNKSYGATKHTEETKQKMRNSKKEFIVSWGDKISKSRKGKPLSDEHKNNLKGIKKPGVTNNKTGFKHTSETKQKISNYRKGKPTKIMPVLQYDKQGNFIKEWRSGQEAEIYYSDRKINVSISACCNGKQKTAFGFTWKFKIDSINK
jgi:hypothetical protein